MIHMITSIKAFSFQIASFWGLGERLGGSIMASLLAIPALFLLRTLYWVNTNAFYISMTVLILGSFFIIHLALCHKINKDPSVIVLDKFLAFIIALTAIQPSIKIIVVGFMLFHLLRFFVPILCYRLWNINFYEFPLRMFSAVAAGLILNLFFRLVLWIAS